MAALPRTFDHVPQDLWERAIISRIQGREAGSGKRHEWAICWRTRQSWTRNNIQPLSRCQGKFAKNARLDSQNAKFWAKTARMRAQSARYAQERHHQALTASLGNAHRLTLGTDRREVCRRHTRSGEIMRSKASFRGHPNHPALIPFPLAFLIGAFLFDLVGVVFNRPALWTTGAYLIVVGVISGVFAAIPGIIDFFYTVPPNSSGKARALKHAGAMVSALILFTVAKWLR